MLRSIALLTAPLLIASPALAADPTMVLVEKDGFHFKYAKELLPGDRVRIYGLDLDRNDRFTLLVEPNGKVHGEFGRTAVSFSVGRKERDRLIASLKRAQPSVAQPGAPELASVRP